MRSIAGRLASRHSRINDFLTTRIAAALAAAAAVVCATNLIQYARVVAESENFVTRFGPLVGGDFVVFFAAAHGALSAPAALYDAAAFDSLMHQVAPPKEHYGLTWQYPPTMLLVVAPLAAASFPAAFAGWVIAAGSAFVLALASIWRAPRPLFFAVASPAAFLAAITGQTGFLTAALIAGAAGFAKDRPILAGVLAGLLTVKPQLGVLLPVAFIAGGCWRAFIVAAATGALLFAVSVAAFGIESWAAFIEAVAAHGGRMQSDIYPYHKLVSVYGGAMMLGAPAQLGLGLQAMATIALAGVVALVWRTSSDACLRLAVLCGAALLASPYAFYYELPIAAGALFALAKIGARDGWLPGERAALAALWLAPALFPGSGAVPGFPLTFAVCAAAFGLIVRRALCVGALRLAASPNPAGV
jgi:hypothetical protein